ncbi:MAG: hypothetical protein IPO15_13425 [Anaerolineae bacterium]|uniref:hypothetical protein n=1 Tax=Candidatus Amarolinea dominans TaxID=3140696 RepID=UPI0031355A83|nr:hypothetical protein [Anaerolineae bacterium]
MPQEGQQRDLLEMAAPERSRNPARPARQWQADKNKQVIALAELGHALGLAGAPGRIECIRHFHLAGHQHSRRDGGLCRGTPMRAITASSRFAAKAAWAPVNLTISPRCADAAPPLPPPSTAS